LEDAKILMVIICLLGILTISSVFGIIVYIRGKKEYGQQKAAYLGISVFLLVISFFLIILGFPLIKQPIFSSTNQTDTSPIGAESDYGIFSIGIGFAILTFATGVVTNIYSGHETDKKIDEVHQYVKKKQENAKKTTSNPEKKDKKEEMERSCFIRILRKTTARRR